LAGASVVSKAAVVEFDGDVHGSIKHALELIRNINDPNTTERPVVIKVGILDHRTKTHSTVSVVEAIVNGFNKAPQIFIAESDNYKGTVLERLQT